MAARFYTAPADDREDDDLEDPADQADADGAGQRAVVERLTHGHHRRDEHPDVRAGADGIRRGRE